MLPLSSLLCLLLLAISAEARIYAWGVNDYGQLGLQQTYTRYPVPIPAYEDVVIKKLMASGTLHMAIADDGTVYVAGNNWYGGLGEVIDIEEPYIIHPTPNDELFGCTVYIGRRHGNAVCPDGKFYGWGVQSGFVAGLSSGNYGKIRASLPLYKLGSNVVNVMAGNGLSYVTVANGTTFVAGAGGSGKLGLGDTKDKPNFVVFNGFSGISARNVSQSHADHVCTISDNFKLYCWGDNSFGQLGIGNTVDQTEPKLVSFFEGKYYPVQVTTGVTHTLCLTASGKVFTWGKAESGALGNGKDDNSTQTTPIEITQLSDKNIVEIVSGKNFNFARTGSNEWYAWGAGSGGVFGTRADYDILKPSLVYFLQSFNVNRIITASTSRSVYGYLDPLAPTEIPDGPPLVNECAGDNPPQCPTNAHCQDTETAYICACNAGYQNSSSGCVDINECFTSGVCVPVATTCTNTAGNFTCTCPPAFPIGDGKTAGTGCKALPVVATTAQSGTSGGAGNSGSTTKANSGSGTTANNNGGNNGITTGSGNGGNGGNGATSGNGGTTKNNGATNGNGGSTTKGNSATTSTTGYVTMYQTLGGYDEQLQEPEVESSSDDRMLGDDQANDDDRYRKIFLATLVGFIALGVAAGVAYMAVR